MGLRHRPTVSIFSPARNAGQARTWSIESVLMQSYQDWEMFVIDDASDTPSAVGLPEIQDDRVHIRFHAGDRVGKLAHYLETAPQMRGQIIVELDGDDWFTGKEALATVAGAYDDPEVGATCGGSVYLRDEPAHRHTLWPIERGIRTTSVWVYTPIRSWRREYMEMLVAMYDSAAARDETTGRPYLYSADVALFGPALVHAEKIAKILRPCYIVNDANGEMDRKRHRGVEEQQRCAEAILNYWRAREG